MVRFLHTSDWHLGMTYPRFGEKGEEMRRIRLRTVADMLERARKEEVDFILVAGDLFDSIPVSKRLEEQALEVLEKAAPVPVFILPGNHDPLEEGSPYLKWRKTHLVIFDRAEPMPILEGTVILYPCPLTQKQSRENPVAWIQVKKQNAIHIGIAHGNVTLVGKEVNFPIDLDVLDPGLDYLALGEWHLPRQFPGKVLAAYAGTPEPTKFGELQGSALLVEIPYPGASPKVEQWNTGYLQWVEREIFLGQEKLEDALASISLTEQQVLRLVIRGHLSQEEWKLWHQWKQKAREHIFWLEGEEKEFSISLEFLQKYFPEGSVVIEVGRKILQMLDKEENTEEKEVCHLALSLLCQWSEELFS